MIQKQNPKILAADTCQTSLNWLEKYVRNWFKDNMPEHGTIWFADENSRGLGSNYPKDGTLVEVVLTGSFLIRILECKLWSFKECRFWVLSPIVKNLLVSIFKFPTDTIGIIPRGHFVSDKSVINFSLPVNLIYAGRLSFAKNITGLLKLVSILQIDFKCDVTLDLYGEVDDFPDESLGRYNPFYIGEIIESMIAELNWVTPPTLHGKVLPEVWLNSVKNNPVFISLSTSMYEDFGVAAEEAKRNGWPCLLSNWGGHKDCSGAYLLPYNLIPQTHEPLFIQHLKSKQLAMILQSPDIAALRTSPQQNNQSHPGTMIKSEYQDLADKLILKWGPEILLCLREKMSFFADTSKGMELFHLYHQAMGKVASETALIVNDLKVNSQYIPLSLEKPFDVIYTRQLFCRHTVLGLSRYKSFYLCELDSELNTVISFLRNCVGWDSDLYSISANSAAKVLS